MTQPLPSDEEASNKHERELEEPDQEEISLGHRSSIISTRLSPRNNPRKFSSVRKARGLALFLKRHEFLESI